MPKRVASKKFLGHMWDWRRGNRLCRQLAWRGRGVNGNRGMRTCNKNSSQAYTTSNDRNIREAYATATTAYLRTIHRSTGLIDSIFEDSIFAKLDRSTGLKRCFCGRIVRPAWDDALPPTDHAYRPITHEAAGLCPRGTRRWPSNLRVDEWCR